MRFLMGMSINVIGVVRKNNKKGNFFSSTVEAFALDVRWSSTFKAL